MVPVFESVAKLTMTISFIAGSTLRNRFDRAAAGLRNPAGLALNSSLGSPERRVNGAGRQAA
jgi:hypothetical protein